MKKVYASLLSLAMCFSLFGCQSANTNEEKTSLNNETKTSALNSLGQMTKNNAGNLAKGNQEKKSAKKDSLDEDVAKALKSLETSYNDVNWGVVYSLDDNNPGVVVSVAPYVEDDTNYLIVGITNLYSDLVDVEADMSAYDKDGNIIGEEDVLELALGQGSTVIYDIDCGNSIPDGRIHWDNIYLGVADEDFTYVPWEMDYEVNSDKVSAKIKYEMYSSIDADLPDGLVEFLLLDKNGNILSYTLDYSTGAQKGDKYKGESSFIISQEDFKNATTVAAFANPYTFE